MPSAFCFMRGMVAEVEMAKQRDVLEALASKEESVKASDLSDEIRASEGTIRTWLGRLKEKGYVDGSGKEGWFITDEGKDALDREKDIPVSLEDVGADTVSKLKYYGQVAGVTGDKILGAIELIMSHDPEDLVWCWEALKQMDVPMDKRRVWISLWSNYLDQPIPPRYKEEIRGAKEEDGEKEAERGEAGPRKSSRDYMIVDDTPVFVGEGLGEFSMKDAKDIIAIKAIRSRPQSQPATSPSGQQGLTIDNVKTIIDMVQAGQGDKGGQKSYIVRQGEEGVEVEEIEGGKPLVVGGGGSTPPKTLFVNQEGQLEEIQPGNPIMISRPEPPKSYFVNPKGEVQELRPGEPIVVKQATQEPSKTFYIKPDGTYEEVAPGQPIIINQPAKGGDSIPVELDDSEGKPMGSVKLQLPDYIKYQKEFTGIRRDEEKHQQLLGIFGEIRKSIPIVAKNIDGIIAGIRGGGPGGGGPGGAGPGSGGGGATVEIPCDACGRMNEVTRGVPTFPCIECGTVNEVTWK